MAATLIPTEIFQFRFSLGAA